MEVIKYPSREEWASLAQRPALDVTTLFDTVRTVLDEVRKGGDAAVIRYEEKFDKIDPATFKRLQVSEQELAEAKELVPEELKQAIRQAKNNIEIFHASQRFTGKKVETTPGVTCWQKAVAIEKVGLYIPGGTAPLFSTVLMLAVPARIAGCKEIVLCTPPGRDGKVHPAILFAAETAGGDYLFLNCGELLKRYLNAHVASCDHDAVGCLDDSFNILNAGAVFDLRDDVDVISSVFVEEASHDVNILAHRNKGACNEINIVFNAEKQILLILLAEVFLLEHLPGEAHALSVAERSAHNDRGMDVISLRNINTEFHKSVVQEYRIAGIKLMRQIFIRNRNLRFVALDIVRGENEAVAGLKLDLAVFECSDAVFGSLCVQHYRNRLLHALPDPLYRLDLRKMLLMRSVGEVQTGNIHARFDHFLKRMLVGAGRSDGADNLRSFHCLLLYC